MKSGERASIEYLNVEQWLSDMLYLLKDYEHWDVFNCDETGIFFQTDAA